MIVRSFGYLPSNYAISIRYIALSKLLLDWRRLQVVLVFSQSMQRPKNQIFFKDDRSRYLAGWCLCSFCAFCTKNLSLFFIKIIQFHFLYFIVHILTRFMLLLMGRRPFLYREACSVNISYHIFQILARREQISMISLVIMTTPATSRFLNVPITSIDRNLRDSHFLHLKQLWKFVLLAHRIALVYVQCRLQ